MLNPQRLSHRREPKREELFTERYAGLLTWALRLTSQNRAAAEDLVQDAFIQFVLGRTSLEEIENIDGYLRRMLRYMHLSRINRNVEKTFDQMLSITDYDWFHRSWRAIEPSRQMQAREELWQICSYACSRKESSRAGAVLILRYFHEYYPSEIARVLCSSRHCVDQWQRLARSELKLYLTGRRGLRFLNSKAAQGPAQTTLVDSNGDLIGELRRMIFRSRQGECLPPEQLRETYQSDSGDPLTATKLGHIVSCRRCLDGVNQLLNLPLLAERFQGGSSPPSEPPTHNTLGGSSGGGPTKGNRRQQQRLREVAEHKPKELRILVNGFPVGSLKVSSDLSELDLSLTHERRVEFVEILSEQDIQLLFFSVSREVGPEAEQWATIELSEGRTLKANLSFKSGPALHVIYREAALQDAKVSIPLALVKAATPSLLSVVSAESKPEQGLANLLSFEERAHSKLDRLRQALRLRIRATAPRDRSPAGTIEIDKSLNEYESSEMNLFGRLSPIIRKPFWARPVWLMAMVSVVTICAFLWSRSNNEPTRIASGLLAQAKAAEEMSGRTSDQVTHKVINLEVRRVSDGAFVSRQTIESWHDFARHRRAQRLYHESGRLISGAWLNADGSETFYHHGIGSRRNPADAQSENLLLNPDDIWQLELSASEFSALAGNAQAAEVIERPDRYLITYDTVRVVGASRLLKATLTLNRTDLRAIEQTLLVQRGGEVWEYRFVEKSLELLPQTNVGPSVFEPERPAGRSLRIGTRGERAIAPSPILPLSPPLPVASAELEVDVAYLLNQAKADRHEQISLSRTANGLLNVEGIVDTEERKAELLRALAPVSHNPAVKIEIGTTATAMQRQANVSASRVTIRELDETDNKVAVDNELRRYLSREDGIQVSAADLDESVRSFSSKTVNRSYRALFHAIELKRLVTRFSNIDMRTVTLDARAKWLQMVREHARAVERETAGLRQEIGPIFFTSSDAGGVADEPEITGDAGLASAVEQLHKLALANNEAIRTAFTISAQSSNWVKSRQFWRSLTSAEKLAARIREYRG